MTEREEELLSAYLDGALEGAEAGEAERLLADSEAARAWLGALARDGEALVRAAARPEVDARGLARMRREVLARVPAPTPGWIERVLAALSPGRVVGFGLPLALALLMAQPGRPPARAIAPPGIEIRELAEGAGAGFTELVLIEGAVASRVPVPGLGIDVLWVTQ